MGVLPRNMKGGARGQARKGTRKLEESDEHGGMRKRERGSGGSEECRYGGFEVTGGDEESRGGEIEGGLPGNVRDRGGREGREKGTEDAGKRRGTGKTVELRSVGSWITGGTRTRTEGAWEKRRASHAMRRDTREPEENKAGKDPGDNRENGGTRGKRRMQENRKCTGKAEVDQDKGGWVVGKKGTKNYGGEQVDPEENRAGTKLEVS
ncbi:hypothetical protein [Paenibacillus mucilaginosus]|uniref:hypothetical protein n=1 Tax=Paenibacillus mucilaginosus TaxID=61624 RepID=UPI001181165E|nr:hypothetical protein [Paenibacillus mucilaginosus]MCG7215385.1 hypothetical protein [Paenibacillus mucilaginosus]WDM30580.1 hypothetical protein KCX80_16130 [Paenibacillus mucilaginosus]